MNRTAIAGKALGRTKCRCRGWRRALPRAFSEKVGTGFPKENATNQESSALSVSLEGALVTEAVQKALQDFVQSDDCFRLQLAYVIARMCLANMMLRPVMPRDFVVRDNEGL